MTSKARRVVRELFERLRKEPECLPTDWHRKLNGGGAEATAQVVADYIAGMTDRFAFDEHQRLCDLRSRTA
jgi:dGTPase